MPEILSLYTAKICPYAHRVELALEEANAEYQSFQVDLKNKPEWYAPKVNPASKVPAVAYGGPQVPLDQPSAESIKIAESLVLLEFVADLYPEAGLLPKDPVLRAKARFFIDTVSTKFTPSYMAVLRGNPDYQLELLKGVEAVQALLPAEGFAIGQWSIADAALIPFIARLLILLDNDIAALPEGSGPQTLQLLQADKFARFQKYVQDVTSRPSYISTFDKDFVRGVLEKRLAEARVQKRANFA